VLRVYREAIDAFHHHPGSYAVKEEWITELAKIGHRRYCTGFYFNDPDQVRPHYEDCLYRGESQSHQFAGKVLERISSRRVRVAIRNKINVGDTLEIITPEGRAPRLENIADLLDAEGRSVSHAQPNTIAILALDTPCDANDLIRKRLSAS
jgi:U32 family peptidase